MGKFCGRGLIGVKVGMTSIFDAAGDQVPVTIVLTGQNMVLGLTPSADGTYTSLKLGYGERKDKHVTKPELGIYKKLGVKPAKFVREFRLKNEEAAGLETGKTMGPDTFSVNQWVDATGTSIGRGFAGVVKMHHMKGMGARGSHGVHEYHRHPGAIGQRKTPGRVYPGKRMPGHMGAERVTIQNLRIVEVDTTDGFVLVSGAIPGHDGSMVVLRPSVRAPRVKKVEESKKPINPMKASKAKG